MITALAGDLGQRGIWVDQATNLDPHPVSGEPLLFLCRRHADCLVGVPPDESERLMDELAEYLYDERFVYRHTWLPGDAIVWDNLMLQHGRTEFDPKWRRHLRRLQIAEHGSAA